MTDVITQHSRKVKRYGWVADLPDVRDLRYTPPPHLKAEALPPKVDLRGQYMPPVYDQGQLGSCTANAIGGAIEYDRRKQGLSDFIPSRLFIYYNERLIEGTVGEDSGAQIRDGVKSVNRAGVCNETLWPYDIAKFARRPTLKIYRAALKCTAVEYARLDSADIAQIKACLADGYPFAFGFSVYSAFESDEVARTGIVNLPQPGERVEGGHAVLAVGYDDTDGGGRFIVRNSWGSGWGQDGYFTIPYDYLTNTNLADDFWTIRSISRDLATKRADEADRVA